MDLMHAGGIQFQEVHSGSQGKKYADQADAAVRNSRTMADKAGSSYAYTNASSPGNEKEAGLFWVHHPAYHQLANLKTLKSNLSFHISNVSRSTFCYRLLPFFLKKFFNSIFPCSFFVYL